MRLSERQLHVLDEVDIFDREAGSPRGTKSALLILLREDQTAYVRVMYINLFPIRR